MASGLRLSALILALAVSLLGSLGRPAFAQDNPRPNVLVVITDDQRNGELRFMDEVRERLVERGQKFSEAYVTTPLCCPSRASIYSGKYAHNHGVVRGASTISQYDLAETWPAHLQEAGYKTGMIGKFLNGWPDNRPPSIFDYYYYPRGDEARATGKRVDSLATKAAIRFLGRGERRDRRPWSLALSIRAPHGPYRPPSYLRDWSPGPFPRNPATQERDVSDKAPSVQANQVSNSGTQYRWDGQAQTLRAADRLLGRFLRRLNRYHEARDTLVIFISDNGFMMGEHGLSAKTWPYLGSIGVPLIVRWPGHIIPGQTADNLVANIDLAPTIYEATGISPDYVLDGRSLLSDSARPWLLLEGPRVREASIYDPWDAYLSHDEHYIDWEDQSDWQEYYDLAEDPYEIQNLLTDQDQGNDAQAPALRTLIENARTCAGASCP